MSEYAQSIGRGDIAGAQKEQRPPKYEEREGVKQARRHVEKANRSPKAKKP